MAQPSAHANDLRADLAAMLGSPDWTKLDELLEEMPPGIPILPPEDAGNFAKYRNKPDRVYAKGEAWQKCAAHMENYDAELCKAHREEIDTLLVFAGLFSAVVTGFTVESYQWLQEDPNDAVISLLSHIALSVATNGTAAVAPQGPSGMARTVSVRVNAYWFVSLALSLATALLAILGKQWVREYERHAAMPAATYVGVRQVKFEGFMYWKVGDIISSLPLLLQLSLALFAIGVLELLWHLDIAIAIAVCVPTALTLLFYLTTTFLPLFHFAFHRPSGNWRSHTPPCAYKSPQALLIIRLYNLTARGWLELANAVQHPYHLLLLWLSAILNKLGIVGTRMQNNVYVRRHYLETWRTWAFWDKAFTDALDARTMARTPSAYSRGLRWLVTDIDEPHVRELVWNCLWDMASSFENTQRLEPRFKTDLAHPFDHQFLFDRELTPRLAAALTLENVHLGLGLRDEILIQNLREDLEPASAATFLWALRGRRDQDETIGISRVVAGYFRRNIHQDLALVFDNACHLIPLITEADTGRRISGGALRSCIILGMLNWLRSSSALRIQLESSSPISATASALTGLISRLEPFDPSYAMLHAMPHVTELATLVKAYCVLHGQRVTWPLPENFDYSVISPINPGYRAGTIIELLKISTCDADRRTDNDAFHSSGTDMQLDIVRPSDLDGGTSSPHHMSEMSFATNSSELLPPRRLHLRVAGTWDSVNDAVPGTGLYVHDSGPQHVDAIDDPSCATMEYTAPGILPEDWGTAATESPEWLATPLASPAVHPATPSQNIRGDPDAEHASVLHGDVVPRAGAPSELAQSSTAPSPLDISHVQPQDDGASTGSRISGYRQWPRTGDKDGSDGTVAASLPQETHQETDS